MPYNPGQMEHGTYHLAQNRRLFEVQRNNNFEFIITDLEDLVRTDATGAVQNAYFPNAQEMLRLSVVNAFAPQMTQEEVQIRRGNSVVKYAGLPQFQDGQLTFNDFLGAHVVDILKAWSNLSYNVETQNVGSVRNTRYKKDCYLIEYGPDYERVRTWKLYGCWIKSIDVGQYNAEEGGKHTVSCTIVYDRAQIDSLDIVD